MGDVLMAAAIFYVQTMSLSPRLSLVSAGGGPGPHKPVIPPPVLASSQPVVGTPQPPPPINTTPPYQVMGKQPYSVKLAGD